MRRVIQAVCIFILCRVSVCYMIDDSSGVGRVFDGLGGLSGGGATSKLLVNYPTEQLNQILDYLFVPNFGASLQILKVEIGGDAQSTDGTESSHMHERWDEDYTRGYEWWLMLEAKKRNPAIKLYGLPWAFPGWVGNGSGDPYKVPLDTATYIVNWILAAKKYYNLDIDYIGDWNERNYDVTYVKTLKSLLVKNGLNNVKIVVADAGWDVSDEVLKQPDFAAAVDIIGTHYPGTYSTANSVKTGKQLWASEDYSTFNDDVGAGCWARILNQNYVNGNMTSTISWNLIASYYPSLPYERDGLMTAEEPWSGHYVVDNPIWITAHTTQFTQIGFSYLKHDSGVGKLMYGGSYVTLTSPDRKQLTIIIETMSHDHSVCIRPGLPPYTVVAQQAEFQLGGSFTKITELFVWKTQLMYDGTPSSVFQSVTSIKPFNGYFTMTLEPDQVYTVTTITTGKKGSYGPAPISRLFPLPFSDDFESYKLNSEAYLFAPQSGVWEVRQSSSPAHGKVNRQVLLSQPIYWCDTSSSTLNIGGDNNWSDVFIEIDILVPSVNGTSGAYVAARVDRGGCGSADAGGLFFFIVPNTNSFIVTSQLARKTVLVNGSISSSVVKADVWFKLTLILKGSMAYGLLNDVDLLFQVQVPANLRKNGFVAYGTSGFGYADFDNIKVQSPNYQTEVNWYNVGRGQEQPDVHMPVVENGPQFNVDSLQTNDGQPISDVHQWYFPPSKSRLVQTYRSGKYRNKAQRL